jgi:thiamine kinase-like enzyme
MLSKVTMQDRQHHQQEVQAFLQKHLGSTHWDFTFPKGSGNETYFVHGNEHAYFVKLGVQTSRYQAMASIGLTPQVLVAGYLTDGTSIVVQPYIAGRKPSRKDYHIHLEQIATTINRTHHSLEVKRVLPAASSNLYSVVGLESLTRIQQRWKHYRAQVPEVAEFVDESLAHLAQQVQCFLGTGLVASHNDICNANWLVSSDGQLYLIDLEPMTLDDPAVDIGATLWWYYPPVLRQRFLEIVGYANDEPFQFRMRVRMAMHCFSITLPREQSFDKFDPTSFDQSLTDFRAILADGENPEGYDDRTFA